MRNIIFLLALVLIYCSCQEDNQGTFEQPMLKENITFTATQGGAVMRYKLPNDDRVFGINVRYKDARNLDVVKMAGYGSDTLLLDGFNAAQKDVPIQITLVDNQNKESEPIEMKFNTEDSAPYSFFNGAKVTPYWGGFQLTYTVSGVVSGMAHVFYLGVNPMTHEADTILVKSFPIAENLEPIVFVLKQLSDKNTVVIRTEDYRGYRVKEQVWKDVESYAFTLLKPENFDFDDNGLSLESVTDKLGVQYLFDGDLKGRRKLESPVSSEMFTYLAGPNATGKPLIVDMREQKIPASVKIYGILMSKKGYPGSWDTSAEYGRIWQARYDDKLPCKVTVYGGNEKDGDQWEELGKFEQNPTSQDRWSVKCWDYASVLQSVEQVNAAKPAVMEILLAAQLTAYRYVKVVVDEVFDFYYGSGTKNPDKFVSMNELEVYVKKD